MALLESLLDMTETNARKSGRLETEFKGLSNQVAVFPVDVRFEFPRWSQHDH